MISAPADTPFAPPAPHPLLGAAAFVGRLLGVPLQLERLRVELATQAASPQAALPMSTAQALLAQAGLAASVLPATQARRPTEMPALLLGPDGRCVVIITLAPGRCECHVPGIEGSTWLSDEALQQEVPGGQWLAVRAPLHFDRRSLLYTLPTAGRWFWDTFHRNRWMLGWALLATLVLNLIGALLPFYNMAVYDRVIPHGALGSLTALSLGAVILIGFELVLRLLRSHLLDAAARRMDVGLSAQVYAQALRMRAAHRPASGGVLANTVRDLESVREFFANSSLTVLGDLPFMLLYVAVIAIVGHWLALVPLLAMPVLLAIGLSARRPLAAKVREAMQESTQRTAHLFESMNGLDHIKALGAEAWARRKWEGLTQAIATNSVQTRAITSRVQYLNAAVLALAGVAVVVVGAVLASEQAMTMGQIIAVSMLTGRALAPISQIAGMIVRWEQTRLSYEALNKIMAAPSDEAVGSLQAPPLSGAVEFRDVGFAYPGQPPVIERLGLRMAAGERVGIIGRLGSGKSTVLRLALNQYEPASGSILLDDIVHTQMDPLSLRRQIGYVPQDVTLFHGSLRENIELGRVQTDDQALLAALHTSGLDEVVAQLPQGVGTQVGERGERLSGGQRQLAALARALLTRPRLLLLDEPSSMLDPASEQKLIARLRALPDTTIVLVTHRMAMLALVDRLIVMDKGRVVADGPRDQVLQALAQQATTGAAS